MAGPDRGARTDKRQRRAWQTLAAGDGLTYSEPFSLDIDNGRLSILFSDTLEVVAAELRVKIAGGTGLLSTADGLVSVAQQRSWMGI